MGVDFLDILMRVERQFGISIPNRDPELSNAQTVGGFYDLILRRLAPDKPEGRITSLAYDSLRQALASVSGADIASIKASTDLSALLPVAGRRVAWKRLESQLGLRLPRLGLPGGVSLVMALITMIIGIVVGRTEGIAAGLMVFAIVIAIAIQLAKPLSVCFPTRYPLGREFLRLRPTRTVTVDDLNEQIVAENYKTLVERTNRWSRDEVWTILTQILVDALDVDPDEIKPESRFVEDLGAS